MSNRERGWAVKFGIGLALALSIPYVIAYFAAGGDWVFSGFLFGVEDGNSYIAKMAQGSAGAWLFRSPYSTMQQQGVLIFQPYLLLGKLAAGPALHEQLVALFHIFRAAATILVAWAVYRISAVFLPDRDSRRWVTAVALLGGGLGWLVVLFSRSGGWLGSLPLDLISPESFGFLSIFGLPHLAMARALGLFALVSYLQAQTHASWGWASGLLLLLCALFQPLTAVSLCVLIAAHQLSLLVAALSADRADDWFVRLRAPAGAAAVVTPYLAYLLLKFSTDPYLRAWTEQNRLSTPHPLHYLAAYGLLLPIALLGADLALRRLGRPGALLVLWMLLFPLLAYAPFTVQRRLSEGVWVALAIAAALGMKRLIERKKAIRAARLLAFAAVLPTSVLIYSGALVSAGSVGRPTFLPAAQVAAYNWLARSAEPGSAVMANYPTGNALPAFAPMRVAVGHGPESVNLDQIDRSLDRYLTMNLSSEEAKEFVEQHQFQYLLMGPEQDQAAANRPPYPDTWDLEYISRGWRVYSRASGGAPADP